MLIQLESRALQISIEAPEPQEQLRPLKNSQFIPQGEGGDHNNKRSIRLNGANGNSNIRIGNIIKMAVPQATIALQTIKMTIWQSTKTKDKVPMNIHSIPPVAGSLSPSNNNRNDHGNGNSKINNHNHPQTTKKRPYTKSSPRCNDIPITSPPKARDFTASGSSPGMTPTLRPLADWGAYP